uniref:Transposase n=1 Tax=Candidatus Kentrum eta TaxID=2126337 RepID=A0A450VIP2_9GAMM|nr:MAG: conserved hypothetical protein (putative transposase or invertase) [Candidatus Kentron sp. H]VFK00736.1 MAG: conserved hypothetical protein (putative transposase or invertase) [Candidatus Kentron sp. H]VFK04669.1 MAG: conserved hypothetical protein (putative transposase or invertase) [Candidatus Kentron sp. H]
MRKGLREGREEGIEVGMEMGRETGARKKAVEMARAALAKGLDIGVVAEISGLSEGEVRTLA